MATMKINLSDYIEIYIHLGGESQALCQKPWQKANDPCNFQSINFITLSESILNSKEKFPPGAAM